MNQQNHNGRSAAELLTDATIELMQFVETRIVMLKTEVREKLRDLKVAAPLGTAGVILLLTAYVLFTMALVALVFAFLPDNAYRWCLAFLAVALLWSIFGGVAAYYAKREFALRGILPTKTIRVLKGDRTWIESEVKNHV